MEEEISRDEEEILDGIRAALKEFEKQREALIPILQMIQEKCGYLPSRAIMMTAGHLQIPSSEVYGVATFYNQFRFTPPGGNPIKVWLGTACHV